MLKRDFIFSLLLFSYTIVLGHSVIPHRHLNVLISTGHNQDSHKNRGHNHNYPFSHCPTLHEAIEKQLLVKSYSAKNIIKKASSNNQYCIFDFFQPIIFSSFSSINLNCYTQPSIRVCRVSFSNRAPPGFFA